jgi:hypothetical protein
VTFTQKGVAPSINHVVWQFWGRAAEAEKSRTLFSIAFDPCLNSRASRRNSQIVIVGSKQSDLQHQPVCVDLDPRHAEQYPPISRRETKIRKRQSLSTCPFSFSNMSLTNSEILPQRKHAMWM